MLVLGIETSCDETAAAVVRGGTTILANVIRSQDELHAPFRGVVPEIAGRSHLVHVLPVIQEALRRAGVSVDDLDAVAVACRPGLVGCLLVGISAAKALSLLRGVPLVGVDHVAAHVHAGHMSRPDQPYPHVSLVASGGHTALYRLAEPGASERIGTSRDDAAGEALDKAAAMLGLPYPGGPSLERAAAGGDPAAIPFPRTRLDPDTLDFSFSGLKTSLLHRLRGADLSRPLPQLEPRALADHAASYQESVVDMLVKRLDQALDRFPETRSLSIGGGVARNQRLRARLAALEHRRAVSIGFPPLDLCSDNAAMIAGLGTLMLERGVAHGMDLDAAATGGR